MAGCKEYHSPIEDDVGGHRTCPSSIRSTLPEATCSLQPGGVKSKFPSVVELNVGGHFFTTRLSTLSKDSSSMLAAMFSGRHTVEQDSFGRYFIDRDGSHFAAILNFLRHGELPPVEQACAVYREAQYYQLTGLIEWCERQANVIAELMYTTARQWLGPEYDQLKDLLLESARERFTRSPGMYLDDKTGFFELTIAFTKRSSSRASSASNSTGTVVQGGGKKLECTEHKFNSDTHKPDAVMSPSLDLETTLNFLRRDFHEAGLSTEWSSIYGDGKSTCEVCQAPMFFLYFRIVLWHWVS